MSTSTPPLLCVIVGDDDREAERHGRAALLEHGPATIVEAPPARHWPFLHPLAGTWPKGPLVVWAPGADAALETGQPPHTRLVTTQAPYLFAEWEAALAAHGSARLVATVRRASLDGHGADLLRRRGIFRHADVRNLAGDAPPSARPPATGSAQADALAAALRLETPEARLGACVAALNLGRTAPALAATASVCQEVNDLAAAARDLDEALALAPDWAALHFERGKVWLRQDDMEAAARCFRAAADQLPRFGGAWGNLGAALGELDRPAEALAAFERLLALDPESPQAHNNIGVVTRELGRLTDSEAAFRRVIALEPDLAFGYYNLGHTLFLQGRYHAAETAYAEGQSRDPEQNPVQATRLALCRLAAGDAAGALAELQRASAALPPDSRRQVLSDTSAILWALVTHEPDLAGWQPVHGWVTTELQKLA